MPRSLTFAERAGIIALLAQSFGAVSTAAYVETRPPDEKDAARRTGYAELAGTIVTTSVLAAVWLAFDQLDGVAEPKRLR